MPSRYAKPVRIPQLRQKLELLYALGRVDGDAALGRLFKSPEKPKGLSGKTIRTWIEGQGSRDKNMIPEQNFARFVEIFKRRLPGNRSLAETRALVVSPNAEDLAAAFRAGVPKLNWISFVLRAQPGGVGIVLWDDPDGFMVTARRRFLLDGLSGSIECPINHYFRFRLDAIDPGWTTVLQWGQSGWFGLELSDESVSLEHSEHGGLFPVYPPYYNENESGVRRYVFITTPAPLPPDLLSKLLTSRANVPLDVSTLDRFAHVASEMAGFRINVLDVHFKVLKVKRGRKLKARAPKSA